MTETTAQNQHVAGNDDAEPDGATTVRDDYATGGPVGVKAATTGGAAPLKDDYATGEPAGSPKDRPQPQDDYAT